MEIHEEFRNDLLKRTEIRGVVSSDGNLGKANALKAVVEAMKVNEEQVLLRSLKNNFGTNEFWIEAFVYDSLEDKNSVERQKVKKIKNTGGTQ